MQQNPLHSQRRLRVVFYLPVVTPWWFTHIVIHLIRAFAVEHEVHVLVPPLWRGTGIGEDQTVLIAEFPEVFWHVLDGPDHPKLRRDASDQSDLLELMKQIDPHLTLCRSADTKAPKLFPGTVRYIMETATPPLNTKPECIWFAPNLFDHGIMPKLSAAEAAALDQLAQPLWPEALAPFERSSRSDFIARHNLPADKTIIGLPLEYEHEENFFDQQHRFASNAAMIEQVLTQLLDDHILAITNHPLNTLYGDNSAAEAAIAASGGQAVLLTDDESAGSTTLALTQHCDGMIIGNSKCWSGCAAFGTPMMRYSHFATGDWARAYTSLPQFLADIAAGKPRRAAPDDACKWFLYHLTNCLIDPTNPQLKSQELIHAAFQSTPPNLWVQAVEKYHAFGNEAATHTSPLEKAQCNA